MSRAPEWEREFDRVYGVLQKLGLSANYLGFYQMACAVQLARTEPERLLLVTKCIYPDVGKHFQVSREAVERNLRTAVKVIWKADTPMLRKVMGEGAWERPCTARFLALLTVYLAGETA